VLAHPLRSSVEASIRQANVACTAGLEVPIGMGGILAKEIRPTKNPQNR
jgi:hypothetical protein